MEEKMDESRVRDVQKRIDRQRRIREREEAARKIEEQQKKRAQRATERSNQARVLKFRCFKSSRILSEKKIQPEAYPPKIKSFTNDEGVNLSRARNREIMFRRKKKLMLKRTKMIAYFLADRLTIIRFNKF